MESKGKTKTQTIAEAARELGIGRNQAYEAARRGEIPTIRIGKRILVLREPLRRMLSGNSARFMRRYFEEVSPLHLSGLARR